MMVCPKCGGKLTAIDKVDVPAKNRTLRKKVCTGCSYTVFTTEEVVDYRYIYDIWNFNHRSTLRKKKRQEEMRNGS